MSNLLESRERQYVSYDWWSGDKDPTPVRCATRKMVTIRKPRTCVAYEGVHECPPGTRGLSERAIVEGVWASWFLCVTCMDAWFQKCGLVSAEARS